jgi:prepilin-type N-terminal cleavage/methylation domain-containing protein
MNRGFSLVELILALAVFQIGILATVGMILLAQGNFRRSEMILRGLVESVRVADSLGAAGTLGSGELSTSWGGVAWSPGSGPVACLRVSAWSALGQDTLATVFAFPALPDAGPGP